MNDKIQRIWKEAVMVTIVAYVWKERKTTKNSSQDSRCLGQDLNQAPPKYKSGALLLYQRAQMNYCYNCVFIAKNKTQKKVDHYYNTSAGKI
jgi:hypothetical protein